jgi:1-deoxy-D-xylulose-5-phosphate synthase
VAQALIRLAERDPRVVAITAAMRLGTGLTPFESAYPAHCFDVGIAEEHAVTLAAGLAAGGMRPYFPVYSTFLQRGYDQIVHDVCLQNLPVCLLIDRAGLVGEDGATHHGVFDIAYLRHIPDLWIFAPRDVQELNAMMDTTLDMEGPCAIRYERDGCDMGETHPYAGFTPGVWERLTIPLDAAQIAVLTFGRMVRVALDSAALLEARGIHAAVVNASTIKPLDAALLEELARKGIPIVTLEEHALLGGFGEAVAGHCVAQRQPSPVACLGIADGFVPHGSIETLLEVCGLTAAQVAFRVEETLQAHPISVTRPADSDSPSTQRAI